jgi:uncharacterized membrane protein
MRTKVLYVIFLAFALSLGASFAFAQDSDWVIDNFHAEIEIQPNGVVKVTETIAVDFKNLEKHGIYRDIPVVYIKEDQSEHYTEISEIKVLRNAQNEENEIIRNSNNIRIKIGDADEVISGKHIYIISYIMRGVLLSYPEYDELYWNTTGHDWEADILHASSTIKLPGESAIQYACYVGERGSTQRCATISSSGTSVTANHNKVLESGEGMTIAVGFRKGLVSIISVQKPLTFADMPWFPIALISFLAAAIIGGFFIVRLWLKKGRDQWIERKSLFDPNQKNAPMPLGGHETIVVEYEAPSNLRPAEVGALRDESVNTVDISASIVDLAVRGYLEITEIPKKGWFGKVDYELTNKKDSDDKLLAYEKLLLSSLFDGRESVKTSALKNKFYTKLKKIKDAVYEEVTQKGFFTANPQKVRIKYAVWGMIVLFSGLAILFVGVAMASSETYKAAAVGMGVGVGTALVGLILASIIATVVMPQRSAQGREEYRKIRGYEIFINNAEKYRQQFFEKENTFMSILPYAMVFGATKKLADAMKDMGVKVDQPSWYHGTMPFNFVHFSDSMNTMASELSTNMSSAPGSSGSGGGGFSGGGFGGGGGGSW